MDGTLRRPALRHLPLRLTALAVALATSLVSLGPLGASPAFAAGDTVAPVVTAPVAAPAPGAQAATAGVPLLVTWTARDPGGSGVMATRLQVSIDGGSWVKVTLAGSAPRQAMASVRPPHDAQFRVRAIDAAGNRSAWSASDPLRVRLHSEASPGVATSGAWSIVAAKAYLGDRALRSRQAGAELSFTFTGSEVAWIGRRSPDGGAARVLLDGLERLVVSTYAATRSDRRILYVATWPDAGEHTITIRTLGTPGHPDVVVDGFVVGDAPPPDPVLVVAGDIATCGYPGDNETARLLDGIPGRVVVAGDLAYPRGTAAEFRDCYDPTWGRWRDRTSPAIGNHEYETAAARPYWDYFGSRAGPRGKGWYAEDLGAWRIYWLNSNCDQVGCGASSEQGAWLAADLAAHPRACVAAVMHHPLVSSGEHGNNPWVQPLWAILRDAGADLVLSGHDHDYERFTALAPNGTPDASGMALFVVGTGGAPLRTIETAKTGSVTRQAATHGVLVLTLRDEGYGWRFEPVAGASFSDSGSAACG
jgi:alkaline phosphatase